MRAMKSIKKSAVIKEDEERLFAEMNVLKSLDHPHIVKLYELFQDEEHYFLITEFFPFPILIKTIIYIGFAAEENCLIKLKA